MAESLGDLRDDAREDLTLLPPIQREDRALAQDHEAGRSSSWASGEPEGGSPIDGTFRGVLQQDLHAQHHQIHRADGLHGWEGQTDLVGAGPEARGGPRAAPPTSGIQCAGMNTLDPGAPLRSLSPARIQYQRAVGGARAAQPAQPAQRSGVAGLTLDPPEHSGTITAAIGDIGTRRCVNIEPSCHLHAEPIHYHGKSDGFSSARHVPPPAPTSFQNPRTSAEVHTFTPRLCVR